MSKKDDLTLVPKYRFPEFKDGEGWEVKELGEILDYLQPTPYLVQTENYDNKYTIPVLTAGKSFILGYTNEQEGIFNNKLPVIIFDDFTTDSKFVDFPFKVKSSAIKILLAKYNFNIKFIFEIMQMVSYEVSVHKRHWISIFSKLKVLIPQSKEQQKIADCLSSIDDLISAEEKKLSLLNDYKKGWMQTLFPSEGKAVPEWRFPAFRNSGEWTSDLIANVISTIRPPKKLSVFEYKMTGRYPIVDQGQDEFCGWTDEKSSLVNFDDKVLIFGDHTCVVKLLDRPFAQGADGIKIIRTTKKISVDFLFQYLCNSPIIPNSYKRHFSELKEKSILFPDLNGGEQEKISEFLLSIDVLIKTEKGKITKLKRHKKALMQGLFPAIEEVL